MIYTEAVDLDEAIDALMGKKRRKHRKQRRHRIFDGAMKPRRRQSVSLPKITLPDIKWD